MSHQPTPPDQKGTTVFSKANLNMTASKTTKNGDLACAVPIIDIPKIGSNVNVYINGVEVNSGGQVFPYDCYFSADGGLTAKILGDEKKGDLLYWNSTIAGYDLDINDLIDFEYLTVYFE